MSLAFLMTAAAGWQTNGQSHKYNFSSALEKELHEYVVTATKIDLDHILHKILGSEDLEVFEKISGDLKEFLFDHFKAVFGCETCLKISPIVDYVLKTPKLRNFAIVIGEAVCILGEIMSPRVCALGLREWGPIGKLKFR